MTKKALTALRASIKHWERLATGMQRKGEGAIRCAIAFDERAACRADRLRMPQQNHTAMGAHPMTELADDWQDITSRDFANIATSAVSAGGRLEENVHGSEFVFFGTRDINGVSVPRLIAARHAKKDGVTIQKCRANMAAVKDIG
jgi:hypothetical protein